MSKRIPASSIADFEVGDKAYQVDLQTAEMSNACVKELERLSLLGIGAYGFMIVHVAMNDGSPTRYLGKVIDHRTLLTCGIFCFALAGACALAATFMSSNCLRWQIDILRMFGRMSSDRWTPEDQKTNAAFAKSRQNLQKFWLRVSWWMVFSSTALLASGAFITALVFAKVLLNG